MLDTHVGEGPVVISFSGIDGAGKTTQIEELSQDLQRRGLRVLRLSFWDDVAVWTNLRGQAGQRAALLHNRREATNSEFVAKNHKHIRKWYLTLARFSLYVLDVFRLRRVLRRSEVKNSDVVIFDRYIYDQIANIDPHRSSARFYSNVLLKRTPRPDLAFILDALPDAAFARKPEYPLEFVYRNRLSFLHLQELAPELIVLGPAGIDEIQQEIHHHLRQFCPMRLCCHGENN
jgi:thymidylate kinase